MAIGEFNKLLVLAGLQHPLRSYLHALGQAGCGLPFHGQRGVLDVLERALDIADVQVVLDGKQGGGAAHEKHQGEHGNTSCQFGLAEHHDRLPFRSCSRYATA
jgi:hypothetical protein